MKLSERLESLGYGKEYYSFHQRKLDIIKEDLSGKVTDLLESILCDEAFPIDERVGIHNLVMDQILEVLANINPTSCATATIKPLSDRMEKMLRDFHNIINKKNAKVVSYGQLEKYDWRVTNALLRRGLLEFEGEGIKLTRNSTEYAYRLTEKTQ